MGYSIQGFGHYALRPFAELCIINNKILKYKMKEVIVRENERKSISVLGDH
ncbi:MULTISPECIES: hypothetical protein [Niastella]|uniref:Uncharacterized protein n=1 Tax=Niastella soli TaxID=2821487 RepID=A0ABS3YUI2_9BACT|nr:hypothetical protein [Niastella soli]MBO9201584.1 hypothetical protein [Niastella soli]